jgi:tRNA threonylcarbamoyladenosine biosynthesis protein TsaB
MLLAIDTSSSMTGIACFRENELLAECVWQSGRDHSQQLLPQIDLLLRHLGQTSAQLQAVAVALGPGSWSGLRVGVSVAKGLALARSIPILGISSLDYLAYQHRQPSLTVYPLIHIGRQRFATATYIDQEPWPGIEGYVNLQLADLPGFIRQPALVCGDLDAPTRAFLQQHLAPSTILPAPAAALRRPGYLAELAWQRYQAEQFNDLNQLEPIYLAQAVTGIRDQGSG